MPSPADDVLVRSGKCSSSAPRWSTATAFMSLGASFVGCWSPWSCAAACRLHFLAALLVLTLLNECVDLWVEQWPDKAMQYGESAKDILLTMTLPTVLMFAVRLRPNLFRPAPLRGKRRR